MREMPTVSNTAYASNAVHLGNAAQNAAQNAAMQANLANNYAAANNAARAVEALHAHKREPVMSRRLVRVFIVDPNENVPIDKAMLYKGDEQFTDATDQELFFEIDMKSILEQHNAVRAKIVDKKVKDRTEYLEPAKIRDLKMVVVSAAGF